MVAFGALKSAFAAGAARGAGSLSGKFLGGQMAVPDFNSLYAKAINETKVGLNLRDLQALEKALREMEPRLLRKFKTDAKRLGEPARKDVLKAFKGMPVSGPRGNPNRKGRVYDKMSTNIGNLSFNNIKTRSAIDINYKSRTPSGFKKSAKAGQKTLSVIRVRVRAAPYIVADMAGASMKARKTSGTLSRPYEINRFGRGKVSSKGHRVSAKNVNNWISRLNQAESVKNNRPSRYAWPALREYAARDYRTKFSGLVNQVVADTNRKLKT
jgi:hypothetical protein